MWNSSSQSVIDDKMNITHSNCMRDSSGYIAFKENCYQLNIVYLVSGWHKKSLTGIICTDVILILPTVVLNFLVLYAVKKHRSLQTTANLLLANLAASDFFIGLLFQPCKIASTILFLNCTSICWLYATVFHLGYYLATVSFLTLTQVSIDRYVALSYPFLYQRLTTVNTTLRIAIISTWTVPLISIILSIIAGRMRIPSILFTILAPLSIVISFVAQISTIKAVRKIRRQDAALSIKMKNNNASPISRKNYVREKANRAAGVILLATVGCYAPHAVLTMVRTLRNDILAFQGIYDWTKTLVIFNSTLNPIIYCWILKEMRTRILHMVFPPRSSSWVNRTAPTMSRFSMTERKQITEAT